MVGVVILQLRVLAAKAAGGANRRRVRKGSEERHPLTIGKTRLLFPGDAQVLWGAFKKKGPRTKRQRLRTVLSTAPGYFKGKSGAETEVPRKTLVKELKAQSQLYSTNAPRKRGELAVRVEVPVRS